MNLLRGCLVIVVVTINTFLVCIPLYVLGVVRLILTPWPSLQRHLATPMDWVIDAWVSVFGALINQLKLIEVTLDNQTSLNKRDQWFVIVSNHQSWVDILLLQTTFRHRLPVLKFFTKRELIWLPLLGLAMWFLGFPYVYRAGAQSKKKEEAHREVNESVLAREGERFLEKPVAVINFVEGTRFTPSKRDARNSPYQHLLAPRRGGIVRVLQILGDRVESMVDVTIHYQGKTPTFWDLLSGNTDPANVTIREIPKPSHDAESITCWLNNLWSEKDDLLTELKGRTNVG